MTRSALAVLAALLATLPVAFGCGPSVQSIHEGNVRFEHCYRLDLELEVASSHRQACWTTWLDRYTYGQSRDRLEYANRRVRAFASGNTNTPTLRVGGDPTAAEESRQFYLVVPAPTNVHSSPPPIATRTASTSTAPTEPAPTASEPLAKAAPGDACSSACKSAFGSCNQACAGQTKSAACQSCDPDYKQCMQRCFE